MTPQAHPNPLHNTLETEAELTMPSLVDTETLDRARRSWLVENWFLAGMIFCVTVFTLALAMYVVVPTIRTLLH